MKKLAIVLASALIAIPGASAAARPAAGPGDTSCYADCDVSEALDFFDFLCFQNAFALQTPYADCDESGGHDFFDFLCFQDAFAAGCPTLEVVPLGVEVAPPLLCGVEVVAFELDDRPVFSDVTSVASPSGGELVFDIPCNVRPLCWAAGCIPWGRGYSGVIYWTNSQPRLEIALPASTAFYFYMMPNPFADIEFEVTAVRGGEAANARDIISGAGEARGFGICGGPETVVIEATDGVTDFAFGEFSIAE